MTLTQPVFIRAATAAQNFAMQNKAKWDDMDIYVVIGEDNTTPAYSDAVKEDAFILRSNSFSSSMERGSIVGAVYVAPVQGNAILGIKVWTA